MGLFTSIAADAVGVTEQSVSLDCHFENAIAIVWQYGTAGKTGSGPNRLNTPVFAIETPNHDIMTVDQGNNRVIEVNQAGSIVFSYGALNNPSSAELLPNDHVLIADENNNRVIEITRDGTIVWQ